MQGLAPLTLDMQRLLYSHQHPDPATCASQKFIVAELSPGQGVGSSLHMAGFLLGLLWSMASSCSGTQTRARVGQGRAPGALKAPATSRMAARSLWHGPHAAESSAAAVCAPCFPQ